MQFEHLKQPARRPGQYPSAPTAPVEEPVVEIVEDETTGEVELTITLPEGEEITEDKEAFLGDHDLGELMTEEDLVEKFEENKDVDVFFTEDEEVPADIEDAAAELVDSEGEKVELEEVVVESPEDLEPAEVKKPEPKPKAAPKKSGGSKKK